MEGMAAIKNTANSALQAALADLDGAVRPAQAADFRCALRHAESGAPAARVTEGLAACLAPFRRMQEALDGCQEAFSERMRACHGVAAGAVTGDASEGPPSDAQMRQYVGALAPCVEREAARLGPLLAEQRDAAVPPAMRDIAAATPRGPVLEARAAAAFAACAAAGAAAAAVVAAVRLK